MMSFSLRKYRSKLDAFFRWLENEGRPSDIVEIRLGTTQQYYRFNYPLKAGAKPKRLSRGEKAAPTFTILDSSRENLDKQVWLWIYRDDEIAIFENVSRITKNSRKPIRLGLDDAEKTLLLNVARTSLTYYVQGNEDMPKGEMPARLESLTDLDVSLWKDGRLRGSIILEGRKLIDGVIEAVRFAARDSRFKPLVPDELSETTIEIIVMSDLRIPLSKKEHGRLYPEKGYRMSHQGKQGWYLPNVFNCVRFYSTRDFMGRLAAERAGINEDELSKSCVEVFEVEDFIESKQPEPITLAGPMPKETIRVLESDVLRRHMKDAAGSLISLQEEDGNIPAIINPITQSVRPVDWSRLAFAAWGLAAFAKEEQDRKYQNVSARMLSFLETYLLKSGAYFSLEPHIRLLTLIFASHAGRYLEDDRFEVPTWEHLVTWEFSKDTDLFLLAYSLAFITTCPQKKETTSRLTQTLLSFIKKRFEEEQKKMVVEHYGALAEVVYACAPIDEVFAKEVADYIAMAQHPDGSFKTSRESDFAYTRGTAKVIEALALYPNDFQKEISAAFNWLYWMQYDEQSMFFVSPRLRERIIGGFRHDYLNQDVWIDAAGHFLLAGARILKNSRS